MITSHTPRASSQDVSLVGCIEHLHALVPSKRSGHNRHKNRNQSYSGCSPVHFNFFFIKVSSSIKSSRLCMTIHDTLHFSNIKLFFGYVGSHFVRLMNNYHHLPGSWNVLKGKSSRCSCRQIMLSCCSCQAGSSETPQ